MSATAGYHVTARCPACLRIVTTTPHLTDDQKCDGVTFAGAVDGFVPVPNDCAVEFDADDKPTIAPVFGEFVLLPEKEPPP